MTLQAKNRLKDDIAAYFHGVAASYPIVLGYLPVALAFGLAAEEAGLSNLGATFTSITVFAGASQFALLGLLEGGTQIAVTVLICLALNVRHIVYGPSLSTRLAPGRQKILPFAAFGLTDEVFSLSMSRIAHIPASRQLVWLLGLETAAYLTWVGFTWAGSFGGKLILSMLPFLETAFSFSIPALFLALLVVMMDRESLIPMLAACLASGLFLYLQLKNLSIIAAAIAGPATWLLLRRQA
ncbi:MAG: AzlC family ABC transporter permease [Desulfohalobiaceae bacterium]|nr:AzlC family ABC transporter permease [Desulfohalobiaceae bacterium]